LLRHRIGWQWADNFLTNLLSIEAHHSLAALFDEQLAENDSSPYLKPIHPICIDSCAIFNKAKKNPCQCDEEIGTYGQRHHRRPWSWRARARAWRLVIQPRLGPHVLDVQDPNRTQTLPEFERLGDRSPDVFVSSTAKRPIRGWRQSVKKDPSPIDILLATTRLVAWMYSAVVLGWPFTTIKPSRCTSVSLILGGLEGVDAPKWEPTAFANWHSNVVIVAGVGWWDVWGWAWGVQPAA
jgi:hypothetical protein